MESNVLSEILKEKRTELKLSRRALAVLCNVSEKTIQRVELGYPIKKEYIYAIAHALGVDVDDGPDSYVHSSLDDGITNLGFIIDESIMELIDDSFDVKSTKVNVYLFQETYKATINGHDMFSERYSYIVLDNGPGTKVDKIFEFGLRDSKRFKNKEDLETSNGIFHYGMVAPLNVGKQIQFYSRESDQKDWYLNELKYNSITSEGTCKIGKCSAPDHINILGKSLVEETDFRIGTLVYAQGIRNDNLGERSLPDLIGKLKGTLSLRYRKYLLNGCEISINGQKLEATDPFMQDKYSEDNNIKSTKFCSFNITLADVLDAADDEIISQEIVSRYAHLYNTDNNVNELLNQSISVDLYGLPKNHNGISWKSIPSYKYPVNPPDHKYSGFYIRRNLRYIGEAAKIPGICDDHNIFNYFRAELAFSPIFDMFFHIQINKNRYQITGFIADLISKKIEKALRIEIKGFRAYIRYRKFECPPPNELFEQYEQVVDSANMIISDTEKTVTKCKRVTIDALDAGCIDESLRITDHLENIRSILIVSQQKYELVNQQLGQFKKIHTSNDGPSENEAKAKDALDISINELKLYANLLSRLREKIEYERSSVEAAIQNRKIILIDSAKLLKERLKKAFDTDRKVLIIESSYDESRFIGEIQAPLSEAEMYGILYSMVLLHPDRFGFSLLDYNENKHIDCLAGILSETVYDSLNMKKRFENEWDDDWKKYPAYQSYSGYSFIELKLKLGDKKDIGHTLSLVSHLVCWEIYDESINEISARDGVYKFSESRELLISSDLNKKIKVIYLKKLIEEIYNCKFRNPEYEL